MRLRLITLGERQHLQPMLSIQVWQEPHDIDWNAIMGVSSDRLLTDECCISCMTLKRVPACVEISPRFTRPQRCRAGTASPPQQPLLRTMTLHPWSRTPGPAELPPMPQPSQVLAVAQSLARTAGMRAWEKRRMLQRGQAMWKQHLHLWVAVVQGTPACRAQRSQKLHQRARPVLPH